MGFVLEEPVYLVVKKNIFCLKRKPLYVMVKKLYLSVKKHIFDGTKNIWWLKTTMFDGLKTTIFHGKKKQKTIFDGKRTIYDG